MTTTFRDVTGVAKLTIEADNPLNPTSVFITGPKGLVMEFDRRTMIDALRREIGLVDPFDVMLSMIEAPAIERDPSPLRAKACAGCVFAARG
jgi:hypothetical protein